MLQKVLISLTLVSGLFFIGSGAMRCQSVTAQISGTITDASGAAIPEAQVTIRSIDTGSTRAVATNNQGFYTIPLLQPGQYLLKVEKTGFESLEQPSFALQVNQALSLDMKMHIGQMTQKVEVTAAAPQLEAASANLGSVIEQKAVVDLPLNGRNFTQLLTLTPGATPISTAQSGSTGTGPLASVGLPGSGFSQPSIDGQWNRSNVYFLDGVTDTSWFGSTYNVLPVIDDIQEFKVQSHNDDPQYGGVLGGVVNVVTKSGTNSFHGSAWEFVRNSDFDARNPFTDATSSSPAPFRQNEFGAAVGGPVDIPKLYNGKNKTWFFFTYEGWRYRQPSQSLLLVPTAAELNGDFSQGSQPIYDPATTTLQSNGTYTRTQFPGNIIPANRISLMSQKFFEQTYDLPNLTGNAAYNYINTGSTSNNNDTYTGRIDQRITDNDSAWFRYSRMYPTVNSPITSYVANTANEVPVSWGAGLTHVFGPNLLLDVRFGYSAENWYSGVVPTAGLASQQALGFQGTTEYGAVDLIPSAPFSDAGLNGPLNNDEKTSNISATFTWVHGNHNISLGYEFFFINYACCATAPGLGQRNQYQFANAQTGDPANFGATGNSLASAMLGLPTSVYFAAQDYDFQLPSWAPFIQDKWRVTPKLTVTLGLRYDYYSTPNLTKGTTSELNPANGDWLIGGGILPASCNSLGVAPCLPGNGSLASIPFGNHIEVASNRNIGPAPVDDNFGPRVGLAYQLTDKIVIRSGYGIVYDSFSGIIQTFQGNIGSWPDATDAQLSTNGLGRPLSNINSLQSVATSALPGASPWSDQNWMYDPKRKNARSQQWNFELQRQMTKNLLLSVGYVGSHSDRLPVTGLFNVSPTPGLGLAGVPYPWATTEFMEESIGGSRYNALQIKAEKRYSNGLQFLLAYSWSKVLEDGGSGVFGSENGPGGSSAVQDLYNLRRNWGLAAYNIPQYFSAAITYDLPIGKGRQFLSSGGALSYVLGNWQVNTVTTLRSGQPFNLDVQGDAANIGNQVGWWNYERPNLVGNPHVANPTANMYFNPAAFAVPVNTFGNFGQNVLHSASVYDVDFSLFRRFPFGEKRSLEFRAEAFNIFNIQSLGVPGVDIGTADAGVVTGVAVHPRQIQLGLKLTF